MFKWKNRKAAIETACNLNAGGVDVETAIVRALGIDEGMFYTLYCTNVETITAGQLDQFEKDVINTIIKRKERALQSNL